MASAQKKNPKKKDTEDSFESDDENELLSKTQLKTQMNALQKMGESLTELSPVSLAKIPMDEDLLDAVMLARRIIRKKEGYRRQLQLIGKIMRHKDIQPIEQALLVIQNSHKKSTDAFHKIELLRDEILQQGDQAIETALQEHPELDRQKLRQYVRQASKQQAENKPLKAARELFQYLKLVING
ncbi:MAG: ribosome-associated protein [Paraglaciecola sp.]|jgi:ribosome-associated protein